MYLDIRPQPAVLCALGYFRKAGHIQTHKTTIEYGWQTGIGSASPLLQANTDFSGLERGRQNKPTARPDTPTSCPSPGVRRNAVLYWCVSFSYTVSFSLQMKYC